ncbi:peptidylprolyl isomerase [Sphingosinicella humi]|uniref:Parvulin-like PPIase n=1 Tax=Allosphingosinicella humi TaxID=2068657 RepID=A0A2U2IYN5_9SPHN|nr:peptidylprolyl isomerase [Sphingosinicella humi]PWG01168.1 peptidylprolyl isomerase [Sphingosinicella humi]
MKLGTFGRAALMLAGSVAAATAVAQTAGDQGGSADVLNIPANPEIFGDTDPSVVKATAIVNGHVITRTDVDQRMALILLANQATEVPPEEMERLRAQVLRNLVDETLQIQAAEAAEIKVTQSEIDNYFGQYAQSFGSTPQAFAEMLRSRGSSDRSVKRQIHGEMAWSRLQSSRIEPFVNVGEEEVQQIIERLQAAKGQQEYRIAEIYLSSTPETAAQAQANAARIVEQLRNGASFPAYARQFSEASTAAVGGDLGWVQAEQLPQALAAAAQNLPVGRVSDPIAIPGGYSIIAVQDTRQILTNDPRDAVLSLKQLSITFPEGMTQAQAEPLVARLAETGQTMGGCGNAEKAAAAIGAEVVSSDQVRARDLPRALQDMLLSMNIGQATTPFGSLADGVRILVLCGRDDPVQTDGPSFDQVYAQLNEERVNRRAQRYLRDLRRDAVVDYR